MFDNIGKKLKGLAYFICFGGIIIFLIFGIILLFDGLILIGLLTIIFGSLESWISSWITYAIGEIAENTSTYHPTSKQTFVHVNNGKEEAEIKKTSVLVSKPSHSQSYQYKTCPHCGETVTSNTCSMCGKENNLF